MRPSPADAHHVREPFAVPQLHAGRFGQLPRGSREHRRADDRRNVAAVVFRARVGLLHRLIADHVRIILALYRVGLAVSHGEDIHALIAALHRHLDMPKAVVLEHLRHIFLELESRQPHAARRAVSPADEQPPEPAEGIGDSPEQEQQQHADSLQKKKQQSADSLEQRNNARRESLQQPIQQGQ